MHVATRFIDSRVTSVQNREGDLLTRSLSKGTSHRSVNAALRENGFEVVGSWVKDPYSDGEHAFVVTV